MSERRVFTTKERKIVANFLGLSMRKVEAVEYLAMLKLREAGDPNGD